MDLLNFEDFDITNKRVNVNNQIKLMLDRTNTIFEWENLPDTVPSWILELILQSNGHCIFTKVDGEYYALVGNMADKKNAYYQPTGYIVANPWINVSKEFSINSLQPLDDDAVLVRNDSTCTGLIPILHKYSSLMADNEITMRMADINMRMFNTIIASDDDSAESAKLYQKQIELGKLAVIADNGLFEGVNINTGANAGSGNYLSQLIEYHQYLKAGVFNEIGLQSNQNMKRERLNTAEVNADEPTLQPLIDNMLAERKRACELINDMFDLNVSVKLAGAWENMEDVEDETEAEQSETEAETVMEQPEATDEPEVLDSSEDAEDESEVNIEDIIEDVAEEIAEEVKDIIEEDAENDEET